MKKCIRNGIAVVLLTLGVSLPSHASPACLAPEPTCVVILLGAAVTAIVHETDEQDARHPQAGPKHATPGAGVNGTDHTDDERRARGPGRGRPVGVPQ